MNMHCKNCIHGTEAGRSALMAGSPAATSEAALNREEIYYKLSLLASMADFMGDERFSIMFEKEDSFALCLLLRGVAQEIFPEWNRKSDTRTE